MIIQFYLLTKKFSMYNYADDNTVLHIDENINQAVSRVERD